MVLAGETQAIAHLLTARAAGKVWFDEAVVTCTLGSLPQPITDALTPPSFDAARFHAVFSAAGRNLGKGAVALTDEERQGLRARNIEGSVDGWGMDELGRAALLGEAFRTLAPERSAVLLEECYARADNRERQAVLRVLPFLPDARRFLPLAVEACRISVQTVFEAIACENAFPAREFADLSFNQMVLKAMFSGIGLGRIVGLERRRGPELARMAADYAAERRAAGRSVPGDIDLVLQGGSAT